MEVFGHMWQPEGVGSYPQVSCVNCTNKRCLWAGKDKCVYCGDKKVTVDGRDLSPLRWDINGLYPEGMIPLEVSGMTIHEIKQDLFTVPKEYYLAHCISADYALGAGIAVQFNKRYDMRRKLKETEPYPGVRSCILIGNVFNLVTKEKAWQKPTYKTLGDALELMRQQISEKNIKRLAMPKIGCGLDRLKWEIVKPMIEEIFNDVNIHIIVCYI